MSDGSMGITALSKSGTDFLLHRAIDRAIDPEFALRPFRSEGGACLDIAAQAPDGHIVSVGTDSSSGVLDTILTKTALDGTPQLSFGTGGVVRVDLGESDYPLAVQVDTEIRLITYAWMSTHLSVFSLEGDLLTRRELFPYGQAALFLSDGTILISSKDSVAAFTRDGEPLPSFGVGGLFRLAEREGLRPSIERPFAGDHITFMVWWCDSEDNCEASVMAITSSGDVAHHSDLPRELGILRAVRNNEIVFDGRTRDDQPPRIIITTIEGAILGEAEIPGATQRTVVHSYTPAGDDVILLGATFSEDSLDVTPFFGAVAHP